MDNLQKEFNDWVNEILPNPIENSAAFCFNLFEDEDAFLIELIATPHYDIDDEDCNWACDEIWSSGDVLFALPHKEVGTQWEDVQETVCIFVEDLIEIDCTASRTLQMAEAVAVGFIDGDIELIWNK